MSIKQLSVSIKQLINSIESTNLKENGPFIKKVWTSAKEMDAIVSDDIPFQRALINDVIALWNQMLEVTQYDLFNNKDEINIYLTVIVKDTCFQILKHLVAPESSRKWICLEMLISLYSFWLALDDTTALARVMDDFRKFDYTIKWDHPSAVKHALALSKAYICQSEYDASKSERWERQLYWVDLAIKPLSTILDRNDSDAIDTIAKELYSLILHLSNQRRKKTEDMIYWLINSTAYISTNGGDEEEDRYAKCFGGFGEPLIDLLIVLCRDNCDIISLPDTQSHQIMSRLNSIPFQQHLVNTPKFFLIKLYLMMSRTNRLHGPDYMFMKELEDEYFCFIEKLYINESVFGGNLAYMTATILKLSKDGYVSLKSILKGLDLLIQRSKEHYDDIISIQNGELYLFKVYILSELIITKAVTIATALTDDPFIEECNQLLKSVMNEEVYLVKEQEIDKVNLDTIITLLWRAGDVLFEKRAFGISLLLYKYTLSLLISQSPNSDNMITLFYKLALCYEKLEDIDSAYVYFKKGFDSCNSPNSENDVGAKECMTLIKYSLLQSTFSQLIVVPPLIEKLGQSKDFDPNNMIFDLIQLCSKHARKTSLLIDILQIAVESFKNATAEKAIPYFKMSFVHQLILIIRCLVYIKVHTYEVIAGDRVPRTKNLDFKSIALYIQRVCQVLEDQSISHMEADRNSALAADLIWLKYNCYNWALFCFSVGRNQEGNAIFTAIERISLYISDQLFNDSQTQTIKIMKSCAEMLIRYQTESESKKDVWFPDQHYSMIKEKLNLLLSSNTKTAFMTPYLNNLFKIKALLEEQKFDEATVIFMEHEKSSEFPLSVLEYMAAFVLQDPQCPIENAFIIVKKLQLCLVENIKDYSKWTRILVTIALKRDLSRQDLYDCLATIINQKVFKKDDYPQNELYYLIVTTWNEGIKCYMKQMTSHGQQYCELAFKLLSSYKSADKKKELEIQMHNAYGLFKSK